MNGPAKNLIYVIASTIIGLVLFRAALALFGTFLPTEIFALRSAGAAFIVIFGSPVVVLPIITYLVIRTEQRANLQPVTRGQWYELIEKGRALAAEKYLGIAIDDFEEFDPVHTAALNAAISEIRQRSK